MRRKYNTWYDVNYSGCFGQYRYNTAQHKWAKSEDTDDGVMYAEFKTFKKAIQNAKELQKIIDPSCDVIITRFFIKKGRRRCIDFIMKKRDKQM